MRKNFRKKGVALIFFVLTFGLLLAFLMLIVNTGMLIYQKIRLQTAVDLAAYAGASVQASYLGSEHSTGQSIRAINANILKRYGRLTRELQFGSFVPWPQGFASAPYHRGSAAAAAACVAACMAANMANGERALSVYQSAVNDIAKEREKVRHILEQLPRASQQAAEETLRLNIPDLAIDSSNQVNAALGQTTNDAKQVVKAGKNSPLRKRKNAVLSFETEKGLYLANVVAPVPHVFAYFGPGCFDLQANHQESAAYWYCMVNGVGAPSIGSNDPFVDGYRSAELAYTKSFSPLENGNIGNLDKISDSNATGIRLHFIQNTNMPDPFFMLSAEWYPPEGSFMNMENSMGAAGSLFPKKTRLVAMAAAAPFGGELITLKPHPFGVRLESIRRLLLDPRMDQAKEDFPNLMDYIASVGPHDQQGNSTEDPTDIIRKIYH